MAAKLLHSLTDENPDLQKQIGCMTGIFQIFDRNQMIVSGRRISDRSHRRTLPRHSQISNGSLEEEIITAHQRHPAEMNLNKNATERQRISTESSRASFSSSRSSSFSSVDYCRSTQPDPAYNDRMIFPEATYGDSQCNISPRLARQSTDFRDAVKDSIIKEAWGLSVNTLNRDLRRDLKLSRDGGRTHRNQSVRDNLKESIRVLSKLQGADWQPTEPKEKPGNSDFGYRSKETSRISYDRMEITRFSFDSRETLQTASEHRDLRRLSLDDRECFMQKSNNDSFPGLKASLKRSGSTNEKGHSLRNVSRSQHRPPSVVAKLMGLEALPDASHGSRKDMGLIKTGRREEVFDAFRSSAETNLRMSIPKSKPLSPKKEPASPRWINSDMKPISSSRIAIEPAPWKKQDGNASSLKQPARRIRSPTRHSNPYPSVYSEIEKRLKEIEFNHSGKDLRALKQILEAIHAKGLLEDKKVEQASNIGTIREQETTLINANQKSASVSQCSARGDSSEVSPRQDNLSRPLDSSIVIMKPISRSPRSQITKKLAVNSDDNLNSTQQITRPQQPKENTASSPRNGSISPRMRLKKLDCEKKNQAQSHSSDANRATPQVTRQPSESGSPGGRSRPKYSNVQQNHGQISEILLDIKELRSQGNEASLPPYRTPTPNSKKDREATRTVRSNKVNGSLSPSKRVSRQPLLVSDQLSNTKADEDGLLIQLADISPEHPSPVSVLNISRYMDDTQEKWLATPPEDFAEAYTPYKFNLIHEPTRTSEISRRKLQTVDNLVQKLKRLNSTHDESRRDYIALLCDNINPDHRYISEILVASGLLLREFGSKASPFQLHPSGNLFDPELFNVLEQTKSSTHLSQGPQCLDEGLTAKAVQSKSHRKLIFDSVSEILIKKLFVSGDLADYYVKPTHKPSARKKAFNAQNLIKEICTEMEQCTWKKKHEHGHNLKDEEENDALLKDLLSEDIMQRSNSWIKFEGGVPEVVLDIERLLFKDLVNEVVTREAVAYRPRSESGSPGKRFLK